MLFVKFCKQPLKHKIFACFWRSTILTVVDLEIRGKFGHIHREECHVKMETGI